MKSGKFLTVNKQHAAFVEKSAMRVNLNVNGSEVSYERGIYGQGWGWLTDFMVRLFWFPPGRLTDTSINWLKYGFWTKL